MKRQLAAILAADIVGFSQLVRKNEEATLKMLQSYRNDLIDPLIKSHHGRIANTAGDSLLAEFSSAVEAVRCAVSMQQKLRDRNRNEPKEQRIEFRIGINVGDVVSQDGDLLGDGVNVAARIESIAEPGSVYLSRAVRDQIREHPEFSLLDLGEVTVKNISRPIRVFKVDDGKKDRPGRTPPRSRKPHISKIAIVATTVVAAVILIGLLLWQPWSTQFETASMARMKFPLPEKPSIAVLPFDNLSSDSNNANFAQAISDDLTNNLGRISGLFVIANKATHAYRGRQVEVSRVAEELGVRHIVLGSVQRSEKQVRVNVQLVDALSGHQVWTERFNGRIEDIFDFQDRVANAISTELAVNLTWSSGRRFTNSVEAHFLWLSAQDDTLASSPQQLAHAERIAKRTIELDPKYSRGFALLALARTQTGYFGYVKERAKAISEGLELSRKAVALAEDDWYSRFVYAHAVMNTRNYEGAVEAYDRAIALAPANAFLLTISALPLNFLGQTDQAISRLETAMRLNPYYTWMPAEFMGQALYLNGRYKEAIPHLEKSNTFNPDFLGNLLWRAATYAQLGEKERARSIVRRILEKQPNFTFSRSFIRIKDPKLMARLRDGWKKAGLPE